MGGKDDGRAYKRLKCSNSSGQKQQLSKRDTWTAASVTCKVVRSAHLEALKQTN